MLSLWPDSRRDFTTLSEREILSLAIAAEEEDGRIYSQFAIRLEGSCPGSAELFEAMAAEQDTHRRRLLDLYVARFGKRLVPIRRAHIRGLPDRKPVWLAETFGLDQARQEVGRMEESARRFYLAAAAQVTDAGIRTLLGDLAARRKSCSARAEAICGGVASPAGPGSSGRLLFNLALFGAPLLVAAGVLIGAA